MIRLTEKPLSLGVAKNHHVAVPRRADVIYPAVQEIVLGVKSVGTMLRPTTFTDCRRKWLMRK